MFERGTNPDQRLLSFSSWQLDQPVEASSIVIRATVPRGELVVYGGGAVALDGSIEQLFGRTKSKYRPVYADAQVRVLENTEAMPRAFVVSRARWSPSIGATLNEMVHRPFRPRQEVVLAADSSMPVPMEPDATGSAEIERYTANEVRVHASTTGEALLVLSDTYYPGWRAFVDGHEQPLLRGDLLFRVVPLPAGEHEVEFRFEPSSVRIGLLISALSLAIAAAVLVMAGMLPKTSRTTN